MKRLLWAAQERRLLQQLVHSKHHLHHHAETALIFRSFASGSGSTNTDSVAASAAAPTKTVNRTHSESQASIREASPNGFSAFWSRYLQQRLPADLPNDNGNDKLQPHQWREAAELLRVFEDKVEEQADDPSQQRMLRIQQGFQLLDRLAAAAADNHRNSNSSNNEPPLKVHHLHNLLLSWQSAWLSQHDINHNKPIQATNFNTQNLHRNNNHSTLSSYAILSPSEVLSRVERYLHKGLVPADPSYWNALIPVWSRHHHPQAAHERLYQPMLSSLSSSRRSATTTTNRPIDTDTFVAMIRAWHGNAQAPTRAMEYLQEWQRQQKSIRPSKSDVRALYAAAMKAHTVSPSLSQVPVLWREMMTMTRETFARDWDNGSSLGGDVNDDVVESLLDEMMGHISRAAGRNSFDWERAADAALALLQEHVEFLQKQQQPQQQQEINSSAEANAQPYIRPSTLLKVLTLLSSCGRADKAVHLVAHQHPAVLEELLNDEAFLVTLSWAFAQQWKLAEARGENSSRNAVTGWQVALDSLCRTLSLPLPLHQQHPTQNFENPDSKRIWGVLLDLWNRQQQQQSSPTSSIHDPISNVVFSIRALESSVRHSLVISRQLQHLLDYCAAAASELHSPNRAREESPQLSSSFSEGANAAAPRLAEAMVGWMEREAVNNAKYLPNPKHYMSVLRAYSNAGETDRCVGYLRKLCDKVEQGYISKEVLSSQHFCVVIAALASREDSNPSLGVEGSRALACIGWMERIGLSPDALVFKTLLASIAKSKNLSGPAKAKEAEAVYSLAGQSCIKSGNLSAKLDRHAYDSFIVIMARSLDPAALARAEELLSEAKLIGHEVGRSAYNALMQGWAKLDAPDKTERIFQALTYDSLSARNLKPNRRDYTVRLRAWSKAGNLEMTLLSLGELTEAYEVGNKDLKPDRQHFAAVVEAWTRSGRPDGPERAESELRQMFKLAEDSHFDCEPDSYTFNLVIAAYSMAGETEKALALLEELHALSCGWLDGWDNTPHPNVNSYNAVLAALSNEPGMEALHKAEALFEQMKEHGIVPNAATYESLIVNHSKSFRGADHVEGLFQENVKKFGFTKHEINRPTFGTHSCRLHIWLKANNPEMTMKSLIEMIEASSFLDRKPGNAEFNAVLQSFSNLKRHGSGELAEGVLREMIRLSSEGGLECAPDVSSFNHVIRAYSSSPNSGFKAMQLLEELKGIDRDGARPDADTYASTVMSLLHSRGSFDPTAHLQNIVRELIAKETSFCNGREWQELPFLIEKSLQSVNLLPHEHSLLKDVQVLKRSVGSKPGQN